jgi:hypothetical protein
MARHATGPKKNLPNLAPVLFGFYGIHITYDPVNHLVCSLRLLVPFFKSEKKKKIHTFKNSSEKQEGKIQ